MYSYQQTCPKTLAEVVAMSKSLGCEHEPAQEAHQVVREVRESMNVSFGMVTANGRDGLENLYHISPRIRLEDANGHDCWGVKVMARRKVIWRMLVGLNALQEITRDMIVVHQMKIHDLAE